MVQQNTVAYIISQMHQGKSLKDINNFLVSAGYDKQEVESSIQYVLNLEKNPQIAEQQRIQQLANYIEQQVQKGYDTNVISNFLISKGYPYYEVNSAINVLRSPKKEVKVEHKLTIIALATIIMVAVGAGIFFFSAFKDVPVPAKLLDVTTNKLTTLSKPGADLSFQVNIVNLGEIRRYDVVLDYEIIEKSTNAVIAQQQETVAISTSTQRVVSLPIPKTTKPGKYLLKATASYETFNASSGFLFEILGEKEVTEREEEVEALIPEEVKQPNITTPGPIVPEIEPPVPPTITPEEPTTPTTPTAPIEEKTVPKTEKEAFLAKTKAEAIELVKAISVYDAGKAVSMCKLFTYDSQQTHCIIELARYKKDPVFCMNINNTLQKDSCLIQIIMETGTTANCPQITDPNIKMSCDMLASAEAAKAKYMPPEVKAASEAALKDLPQINFKIP